MNEACLDSTLFGADERGIQQYQLDLIDELKNYKYTAGLRDLLGKYRFGRAEIQQLRVMARETFEPKEEFKNQLSREL